MLQEKTLKYYDWDDIELHLCEKLGIYPNQFRDYHEVVGGEFKDWWLVWLTLVHDNVSNDSVRHVYISEYAWEQAVNEHGDWVLTIRPFVDGILGEDGIYVFYSW